MSSPVVRLIAFGIMSLSTTAVLTQTSMTMGAPPIHHFPLDGNVVDVVGGALLLSTDGLAEADGYIGTAIHFDGSAFAEIAVDIAPSALPELTIVALVKPDQLPEDAEALGDVYPTGYVFSDGDGLVYLGEQQKRMPFFAAQSTGAVISNSVHPGMRNGWQLVAFTRSIKSMPTDDGDADHNQIMLYTNGRVSEDVRVNNNLLVLPVLRLGTINPGSASTFHGAIDHLSIYDYAMSKEELDNMRVALRQNYAPVAGGGEGGGAGVGAGGGPAAGDGGADIYSPFAGPIVDAPDLLGDAPGGAFFNGDWGIADLSFVSTTGREFLYPGDRFGIRYVVRKRDPNNEFPFARLRITFLGSDRSFRFHANANALQPFSENSGTSYFTAPASSGPSGSADAIGRIALASLLDAEYTPLLDDIVENNKRRLSIIVKRPPEEEGPAEPGDDPPSSRFTYPDIGIHSEISGSAGEKVVSLSFFDSQDVVTQIEVREKNGTPCQIRAVSNGSAVSHAECTFDQSPTAPSFGHVANPITALQICRADFNDRVKGLRVWRQTLDGDGSFAPFQNYDVGRAITQFNNGNCFAWREIVACEWNAVATGLRAHFTGNGGAIVGLQLMCTQVDPT